MQASVQNILQSFSLQACKAAPRSPRWSLPSLLQYEHTATCNASVKMYSGHLVSLVRFGWHSRPRVRPRNIRTVAGGPSAGAKTGAARSGAGMSSSSSCCIWSSVSGGVLCGASCSSTSSLPSSDCAAWRCTARCGDAAADADALAGLECLPAVLGNAGNFCVFAMSTPAPCDALASAAAAFAGGGGMSVRGWSPFRELAGGIWPLVPLSSCGGAPRGDGDGTWSYTIRKGFSVFDASPAKPGRTQKSCRCERIRLQPRRLTGHKGEEEARHFAHHQEVCDGEGHEADALSELERPTTARLRPVGARGVNEVRCGRWRSAWSQNFTVGSPLKR